MQEIIVLVIVVFTCFLNRARGAHGVCTLYGQSPPELWVELSPLSPSNSRLPLLCSSSGPTRPLAAAALWPRAGLIPSADPGRCDGGGTTGPNHPAHGGWIDGLPRGEERPWLRMKHRAKCDTHTRSCTSHTGLSCCATLRACACGGSRRVTRGEAADIIVWGGGAHPAAAAAAAPCCQTRKWSFTHTRTRPFQRARTARTFIFITLHHEHAPTGITCRTTPISEVGGRGEARGALRTTCTHCPTCCGGRVVLLQAALHLLFWVITVCVSKVRLARARHRPDVSRCGTCSRGDGAWMWPSFRPRTPAPPPAPGAAGGWVVGAAAVFSRFGTFNL